VKACLCRKGVPPGDRYDLIDHRYFFQCEGRGNYTCGLARDAVGDQLLLEENFADTNFLVSLPEFINNKSIARFMIEYAILSSIRSKGLNIGAGIGSAMELRPLETPPEVDNAITGKPVLYRPRKVNFKTIDGIIILIKPNKLNDEEDTENGKEKRKKKKMLMFPFQIAVAPATHANSREEFFEEYSRWITNLSKFDVEVQFLWITPECSQSQEYPAEPKRKWPKHVERYIPFKDVDKGIAEDYEEAQKRVPKDEAASRKLQPNQPTRNQPEDL
jgi:hypothetical protein